MTFSPKVWSDALRRLQNEIPDFTIDAWIKPLAVKIDEQRLVLGCPNSFHRDRVRLQHFETIERCWADACRADEDSAQDQGQTQRSHSVSVFTMPEFAEASGREIDALRLLEEHTARRDPAKMRKVGSASELPENIARVRVANGANNSLNDHNTHTDEPHTLGAHSLSSTTTKNGTSSGPVARMPAPPEAFAPKPFAPGDESPGTAMPIARSLSRRTGISTSTPSASPAAPAGWDGQQKAGTAKKAAGSVALTSPLPDDASADASSKAPRPPTGPRNSLSFDLEGAGPASTHPFSFESFIVGPCNALAREATLALARRRQQSLNQLYLGSGPGMGKTHLAKAAAIEARRMLVGNSVASRPTPHSLRVIYTTAEQFTTDFVSAMRHNRNDEWTKRYRGPIELLIVEDIPCLAGRTKTQEELAQTIRHVLDSGGRVLLTGDRPPRDLTNLEECLRSQVQRGFVAELDRPDALVRRHLLRAKSAAGGVHLPADCLDLLVQASASAAERGPAQASGSIRDLEGILIQVVTTASLLGRPIDLELTQEAVDLKSGAGSALEPTKLSVAEVVHIVAAFFGKRPEALASRSRRRDVLIPRQLAMYLSHRYTESTLSEIGRALGRDHPAVRNALTRVERQVLENAPLRYQVEALSERIDLRLKEIAELR